MQKYYKYGNYRFPDSYEYCSNSTILLAYVQILLHLYTRIVLIRMLIYRLSPQRYCIFRKYASLGNIEKTERERWSIRKIFQGEIFAQMNFLYYLCDKNNGYVKSEYSLFGKFGRTSGAVL